MYSEQGKSAEAESLFKRSLKIDEIALGPEHPTVATTLNNLAILYKGQGKLVVHQLWIDESRHFVG